MMQLINPEDHLRVRQAMQNALVYGDMAQVRLPPSCSTLNSQRWTHNALST